MDRYRGSRQLTPREAWQAEVYTDMAGYFLILGMNSLAIYFYNKAIALTFWNPALYTGRACAYFYLHRFYMAIEDCDTALLINPNYTPAMEVSWCAYGSLEYCTMLNRMTYNYFRAYHPYRPRTFQPGKYCDSDLDCEQQRFPPEYAEQMLTLETIELGDFYVNHALLALKANRNWMGVYLATEAAKYNPLHTAAYYIMALCYVNLKDYGKAINAFYKVEILEFRKNPDEPVNIYAKTNAFIGIAGITNYQNTNLLHFFAVCDIELHLENNLLTKTSSEYMYLGNKDMERGDFYGAILWYTKAIRANNLWAEYRTARARAYTMVYKYRPAYKDCIEALRLNFKCCEAFDALGIIALCRGDWMEACRFFITAKKSNRRNTVYGYHFDEAIERLKWLLFELDPVMSGDLDAWIGRLEVETRPSSRTTVEEDRLSVFFEDAASYHMFY